MNVIQAIIIAIVEGLTEFLPVSSTGHMIITQSLLGMEATDFSKTFTVVIQFGAILSVLVLYWKRFWHVNRVTVFDRSADADRSFLQKIGAYTTRILYKFDFYWKLFLACIPGFVLGMLFNDMIDEALGSVTIVAWMLIIGGILMLFVDKWFNKVSKNQEITTRRAILIGFSQCLAMFFPGFSRSMATIVGGMATQLSRKNAAEFSFFLAVPTMLGASLIAVLKTIKQSGVELFLQGNNLLILVIGNVVAFIVAMIAIKFFIEFLTKYGFKAFGYYRIIVGGVLLLLILSGANLSMV